MLINTTCRTGDAAGDGGAPHAHPVNDRKKISIHDPRPSRFLTAALRWRQAAWRRRPVRAHAMEVMRDRPAGGRWQTARRTASDRFYQPDQSDTVMDHGIRHR